jgi:hypothetical protein
VLRDVRVGIYADIDSRRRADASGHLNDLIGERAYDTSVPEGVSVLGGPPIFIKTCVTRFQGSVPVVSDADPRQGLPAVSLLGLAHTTDPLGWLNIYAFPGAREAQAQARAPYRDTTFHYAVFANDYPPGQGGPPIVDRDRYAAMEGTYPEAPREQARDWTVLLSCGPFAHLAPGQQVEMDVAFVVAPSPDSIAAGCTNARMAWRGSRYSFQPDRQSHQWNAGETGINGHEVCYEPPPGMVFNYDPHCPTKFYTDTVYYDLRAATDWLRPTEVTYQAGGCVWSDFDCDACTGLDGRETHVPWQVAGLTPPKPAMAVTGVDSSMEVAWDNTPENVLLAGGWDPAYRFGGYRVYRLDDWRRESVLPGPERWQRIAAFRPPGLDFAGTPLSSITDPTVVSDGSVYGNPHFPVGRYRYVDPEVRAGFDYLYVVTTVFTKLTLIAGAPVLAELESPLTASFDDRVVPHVAAKPSPGAVWVVPNPYHGGASWERSAIPGDPFTRHLDFFGLPRARATIRIYTLAGDLVQTIVHDGANGDGQAPWNLISRNGQEVESGVYLFTVESPLGHQVGKFVLMR